MNKRTILLAILLAALCAPAFAQVTTKYGDVVSTLDGIMKAYYDVVTVKKGQKVSYERDSLLHIKHAGVGVISTGKDGKPKFEFRFPNSLAEQNWNTGLFPEWKTPRPWVFPGGKMVA